MRSAHLEIGNYGVSRTHAMSTYEDECVGSGPQVQQGIVVSSILGETVMVSEWQISTDIGGEHTLEQFEESKHNQEFDFEFFNEHELMADEHLEGTDPLLKQHLRQHLLQKKGEAGILDKLGRFMRRDMH